MEARIRFSSEVYIQGDTIDEIRQKWEHLRLFTTDALEVYADVIDVECVEDADTGKEISGGFF